MYSKGVVAKCNGAVARAVCLYTHDTKANTQERRISEVCSELGNGCHTYTYL